MLTALVAGLVVLAFTVVAVVGRVVLVRDSAGVAADQAALAAAAALAGTSRDGDADRLDRTACPVADEVVRRNGARMVGCTVTGDAQEFVVTVTVEADLGFRTPGLPRNVRREATAGRVER